MSERDDKIMMKICIKLSINAPFRIIIQFNMHLFCDKIMID
jgi:hypothetical protein